MAGEDKTRYCARVWENEDTPVFAAQEHEYERNCIAFVTVAILVFAVTSFTTHAVERLLLRNFPSLSQEWCFTSATQKDTKLQRAQNLIIKIASALSLFCRWPLGMLAPIHLWQTVYSVGCLLAIVELSLVAALGTVVGFIRIAHYAAQITGWEHPSSPAHAFAPGEYSKEHRPFSSPPMVMYVSPGWTINNSRVSTTHNDRNSISSSTPTTFDDSKTTISGKDANVTRTCHSNSIDVNNTKSDINVTNLIDSTQLSFMGFSPTALSRSTWLKTRTLANSIFSNSTQSSDSRDSFGGPSARHSRSLEYAQHASNADKKAKVPDLLTGTPR